MKTGFEPIEHLLSNKEKKSIGVFESRQTKCRDQDQDLGKCIEIKSKKLGIRENPGPLKIAGLVPGSRNVPRMGETLKSLETKQKFYSEKFRVLEIQIFIKKIKKMKGFS